MQLPYYKEQFADDGVQGGYQALNGLGQPTGTPDIGVWPARDTVMTGFRTRPKSDYFEEVVDQIADPYGYFLEDVSKRQYEENLRQRGYTFTNPLPDRGHALDLRTFSQYGERISGRVAANLGGFWAYYGHINAVPTTGVYNSGPFQGDVVNPATYPASSLPAFAQKAYARSAPTFEQFNLTHFLGELHELPRVRVDFLSKSIGEWRFQGDKWIQKGGNRLGDDYLNVIFGWAPLVKDWIALCKALVSITTGVMGGPEAARPIHRTYGIPEAFSSSLDESYSETMDYRNNSILTGAAASSRPPMSAAVLGPQVLYTVRKTLKRDMWFEGAFTKFLPLGFDPSSYLDRASVLLNTEVDIETIWKLTPWTWLSDWVVDISSTIAANQAASDKSLMSHYAYAMEKTTATVYLDWEVLSKSNRVWTPSGPTKGSLVTETVWKKRIRANPFGFMPGGPSDLDPYRLAVLAALGLSRL